MSKMVFPERVVERISYLETQHQVLKQRVTELHDRRLLTPAEQMLMSELKKEKLATKDTLTQMRRQSVIPTG